MNKQKKKYELSDMMQQYLQTKEQYKDCIIFYRLGDFYEMFFDDAKLVSKELDITLTGRDCGLEERAPMCGIPHHAYESYAQKLIERGYKIAICEQTDKIVNKLVQREVVRIITPGTVIDSSMLNETSNSYIMCIYLSGKSVGYAYSDMTTGEFCTANYSGDNILAYINDQITRVMPSEIICNDEMYKLIDNLPSKKTSNIQFNQFYNWSFSYNNAKATILKQYSLHELKGYDFDKKECVISVGALLTYFEETQKRPLKHLKLPKLLREDQFMYLDTNTWRNLEIERTMHEGSKKGSLLWVLDQTKTNGGARLLKNWLKQPLQNKDLINDRLDMVEFLTKDLVLNKNLSIALAEIQDIERIVGRIAYNTITPKECKALSSSLQKTTIVKNLLLSSGNKKLINLANEIKDTTLISNLIDSIISENPPAVLKEGKYIREGFNKQLDELRNLKDDSEKYILGIQAREREATGIKNLKIGYNRVFGYYIEVSKMYGDLVPFNYIRKQTISNNERYITEELKEFEEKVLTSHDDALALENKIFKELKSQLLDNVEVMQTVASTISTIDCLYSLSEVAITNDYVRPNIIDGKEINIVEGRHPVIEKSSNTNFVSNDCLLNDDDQRTIILTGPNMAGKSTYMRQVALITYLAHIGCFVPAKSADICLVDRIFTRIGASDDLSVGQSTFMVEMIEVSNILHNCTNNSLIILDEVGRGTSTFDGLSIAWAVVEYLSKHLNAKTLFATHYHELMRLEGIYKGVKNFCISIKEIGGKLVFLRKIMRGSITRSYGIEVASLAGLPDEIINRAKELIKEFENEKAGETLEKESQIINMLKEINTDNLTPLVAFDTLIHLIDLVK